MRLDRFLTLRLFQPLQILSTREQGDMLPILMYHSVSNDADEDARPYFRTVTSPTAFARQMRHLTDSGYEATTLSHALREMRDVARAGVRKPMARRPVVITFDDGFRDIYTTAFPV